MVLMDTLNDNLLSEVYRLTCANTYPAVGALSIRRKSCTDSSVTLCLQKEVLKILAAEAQALQKMHVALAKQLKALKVAELLPQYLPRRVAQHHGHRAFSV